MSRLKVSGWVPCLRYACTYVCIKTIEPQKMFHGNDLNAQRNLCGSGDLNAQRIFRGDGDLKVFDVQRKCDLVKLGRLQQDLVKLVLLRWREWIPDHPRHWNSLSLWIHIPSQKVCGLSKPTYINSLQSPSQKVCGSIVYNIFTHICPLYDPYCKHGWFGDGGSPYSIAT